MVVEPVYLWQLLETYALYGGWKYLFLVLLQLVFIGLQNTEIKIISLQSPIFLSQIFKTNTTF